MRIFSRACSVVRERVLFSLMIFFAAVSAMSVIIHYSWAGNDYQSSLYISVPEKILVGEPFTLRVMAESKIPLNVFSGSLSYDPEVLSAATIDNKSSIVDLWVSTPTLTEKMLGEISFSGGTTDGFLGQGSLFEVTFWPQVSGENTIVNLENIKLLQHDGRGTEASAASSTSLSLFVSQNNLTVPATQKSYIDEFDLNGDGRHSFNDVGIYMEYLQTGDKRADLDQNGEVNEADLDLLKKKLVI